MRVDERSEQRSTRTIETIAQEYTITIIVTMYGKNQKLNLEEKLKKRNKDCLKQKKVLNVLPFDLNKRKKKISLLFCPCLTTRHNI